LAFLSYLQKYFLFESTINEAMTAAG